MPNTNAEIREMMIRVTADVVASIRSELMDEIGALIIRLQNARSGISDGTAAAYRDGIVQTRGSRVDTLAVRLAEAAQGVTRLEKMASRCTDDVQAQE